MLLGSFWESATPLCIDHTYYCKEVFDAIIPFIVTFQVLTAMQSLHHQSTTQMVIR